MKGKSCAIGMVGRGRGRAMWCDAVRNDAVPNDAVRCDAADAL